MTIATDHKPAARDVDTILADLRAQHDETVRGLKADATRLAEERDRERTRADGIEAASLLLVEEHVRRENALEAEANGLLRANFALQDTIDDLQGRLDAEHLDNRRNAEHVVRLVADIRDLQTELANQPARRLLRRGVRRS